MHGIINVPQSIVDAADRIKFENYKVNTIQKIRKHNDVTDDSLKMLAELGTIVNIDSNKFDMVYFSVCEGADPHVDLLDPDKFEDTTFIIPIILPSGDSIITAEEASVIVEVNEVYEFDHSKMHSMTLEDSKSGCVVVMVAVKKDDV